MALTKGMKPATTPHTAAFGFVLLAFALFGTTYGVWLVLIADLQRAFDLSPGALGGALAAGLAAALPVMLLAGRIADRWGAKVLLKGAALLIGCALLGIAVVQTYGLLVLLLMLFFASTGAFDVGINTAAVALEQRSGRKILSYVHAAFSGSAALTALLTGALLSYGMPFRWLYVALALLVVTFAVVLRRGGGARTAALPAASVPTASSPIASSTASDRPLPLYRSGPVLLLALITAFGFQIEGEVGNWAAVYLRALLELPPWLGASGVAVFHGAMLIGRLGAARALQRVHRRSLLGLAGAVAAGGMLLALATEQAAVVLLGFLITGLAVAVVAPVTFSLLGDTVPDRVGEASSVLTTVAYLGLLLGPVIIGGLAEVMGLRLALGSIVFMGGLISLLSCGVLRGRPVTSSRASAAYLDGSGA